MLVPGVARNRLAGILGSAFADGLLSEQTLSHRLGMLFGQRLVDPRGVIGDLTTRTQRRRRPVSAAWRRALPQRRQAETAALLLALIDDSVSRRHAKLIFRGGEWIIQDLESTNGTIVNGVPVGRCQLMPGDRLRLGELVLEID